jgi:hypothetical protein
MQGATMGPDVSEIAELKLASTLWNRKSDRHFVRNKLDETSREESQGLVRNIFATGDAGTPRFIVFAGIDNWDSCGRVCANAADALANQGSGNVCVVTENSRSPAFRELLGTDESISSDVLPNCGSVRGLARPVRSDNLWLLSCEWLGLSLSAATSVRTAELKRDFRYVCVESPPLNKYSDGLALAKLSDGIVLVLEVNSTSRHEAARVLQSLRDSQIKILGAVLDRQSQ